MTGSVSYLSVLVPVDVDPAEDGQRGELVLLVAALGRVLLAVDALVLEEDAALLDGALQVEHGRAAVLEALDAGAALLAVEALDRQRLLQGHVHVHQRPVHHLEDVLVPQGAVQVHPPAAINPTRVNHRNQTLG